MQKDMQKTKKDVEKEIKEKIQISIEKSKIENIRELKTLSEIMKENP